MANILKNSFFVGALGSFFSVLKRAWQNGALVSLSETLKKAYQSSVSKSLWERFCAVREPGASSFYIRVLRKLEVGLFKLGDLVRQSFVYRIMGGLCGFYQRLSEKSRVLALINRLSLKQWLLVGFALYLPLEYVIRNILRISILSAAWEELFLLAALAMVLWNISLRRSQVLGRTTLVESGIILFMAVGLLLMSLVAPHPAVAAAGYRAQVEYMLWFFLIIRLLETEKDFKVLYVTFAAMVSLLCLHGIYQFVIGVPIPASWVTQTEMGVRTRVFSLTGSPNIFGSLIVLGAPLVAALIYYCKKPLVKFFFFGLTGMMCLCLLFTFSRGAWVGIVVAVAIFSLYVDKRLLGLMGMAVATVLVAVPSITSRLTYLFTSEYAEASAIGGRTLRWELGRTLLTENSPWVGFGLGRFGGAVAMNNQLLDKTDTFEYFYLDNYYLKTMVEMGYLGLFFYLALILVLLVWGFRAIYRSGMDFIPAQKKDALLCNIGNYKVLAAGIFSGLCGVLVHCYFENIFEEPYMMAYFWGLAAMLLYLGFFQKSHSCQDD